MADENPTRGQRIVAVDLPAEQVDLLRAELMSWLGGLRDDLRTPERLPPPERSLREAITYERLLAALDRGQIAIPDERRAWRSSIHSRTGIPSRSRTKIARAVPPTQSAIRARRRDSG